MVDAIRGGGLESFPSDLTNVGGTLLFTANDGTHGYELWQSDGTQAGTFMVDDIHPGLASGTRSYYYSDADLTNVNGTVFFAATDGSTGVELWKATPPLSPPPPPPPPAPPVGTVDRVTAKGKSVKVVVTCTGGAGTTCVFTAGASVVEKINKHGKVIAVTAKHHKPKFHKKTVGVGSRTVTVPAGTTVTLTVTLNGTGNKLLKKHHPLRSKLKVTSNGTLIDTKTVSFTLPKKHHHHKHKHLTHGGLRCGGAGEDHLVVREAVR